MNLRIIRVGVRVTPGTLTGRRILKWISQPQPGSRVS